VRLAFAISVFFAIGGVLFNGFTGNSLLAFAFIVFSTLPLLIASVGIENPVEKLAWRQKPMMVLRAIFLPLAVLNVVVVVSRSGFSLAQVLTPDGLMAMAAQSTFERYVYGTAESNPLLIAASIINAFLWPSLRVPLAVAMIPGLLPIGLHSVVSTEKWPFFCGFVFFSVGAVFAAQERTSRARYWLGGAGVAVAAVLIAVVSLLLRAGAADSTTALGLIPDVTVVIGHYLFAQYEAFGTWLGGHWSECCTLGQYSFIGIADFFGLAEREQGVWTDTVAIYGIETNIYTAWRYLITDFSIVGPFVLVSVYAMLLRFCILTRRTSIAVGLVTLCLITAALQNNVTPFVHNSIALAAIFCSSVASFCLGPRHEQT
jgi:hypothetical protein